MTSLSVNRLEPLGLSHSHSHSHFISRNRQILARITKQRSSTQWGLDLAWAHCTCLSVCLSVRPSIYLSVYLSARLLDYIFCSFGFYYLIYIKQLHVYLMTADG